VGGRKVVGVEPVEDRLPGWLGGDDALAAKSGQAELHARDRPFTDQRVDLPARERRVGAGQHLQDAAIGRMRDQLQRMGQVQG
jgi:hypothetical protein